jgi:hypothetical protein
MTATHVNLWQLHVTSYASFPCLNIDVIQDLIDARLFSLKFTLISTFSSTFGFVAGVSYRKVLSAEIGLKLLQ